MKMNRHPNTPVLHALRNLFSIDLRSLALFRVLIAIAVIANITVLALDLNAFLSDNGLYTRAHAISNASPYHFSLYYISGAAWYSLILLLLTLFAALAMLFGFRTRIATVITWVLIASLSNRISGLASGADTQLTVLLFWAMFLPLGARFSIDAATAKNVGSNNYFSVATIAALLQVLYLYFIGALLKTGSFWVHTHEAVHYALSSVQITTPLASLLVSFPEVTRWLTVYVFYLELFAIAFVFAPVVFQHTQAFVLPQLVAMHAGFALFLAIGFFPLISIAGLMLFLPALFWDKILHWWNTRRSRSNITIYYDQHCGFCYKTCLIFRTLALPAATPILTAQTHQSANQILQQEGSWSVHTHTGLFLSRWDAVAYLWRRSPLLWPLGILFALPPFRHLGNALYGVIARNRAAMGRFTETTVPFRETALFWPRRETSLILGLLATLVFLWNIDTIKTGFVFPEKVKPIMWATRLPQKWNMFAPQPLHASRWLVVEGVHEEGHKVDLLRNGDESPTHGLPRHGYEAFPGYRWRKYYSRVDVAAEQDNLGLYYCNKGLLLSGKPMAAVHLYAYRLPMWTLDDTLDKPSVSITTVEYPCGDRTDS